MGMQAYTCNGECGRLLTQLFRLSNVFCLQACSSGDVQVIFCSQGLLLLLLGTAFGHSIAGGVGCSHDTRMKISPDVLDH